MQSKRTTIRTETYEVTTVRRRPSTLRAWCVACADEVEMMTPERAAEWAAVPHATISGWLEGGKLHLAEIAPRLLYICRNSLQQQVAAGLPRQKTGGIKPPLPSDSAGQRSNVRRNKLNSKGELP